MIYIQSETKGLIPHHFDAACAMYGAIEEGKDYHLVQYDRIESGMYDARIKRNLFVGSVEFMTEVFKRAGITKQPRVPVNSNRPFDLITLGDAKKRAQSQDIFIKPFEIKLFTGFVMDGFQYSCLDKIPDSTIVMVYEPFKSNILSEWRVYIHDNKISYVGNYAGNPTVSVNWTAAAKTIRSNTGIFPCAYTMDIGILADGDNVVIEYNDMWAIGNYGMPNDLYLKLLTDRYFEIIRNGR